MYPSFESLKEYVARDLDKNFGDAVKIRFSSQGKTLSCRVVDTETQNFDNYLLKTVKRAIEQHGAEYAALSDFNKGEYKFEFAMTDYRS